MIYTINIPDERIHTRVEDFFDWIETTQDGANFLAYCFDGSIAAALTGYVARDFNIPPGDLWGIVLRCYEQNKKLNICQKLEVSRRNQKERDFRKRVQRD